MKSRYLLWSCAVGIALLSGIARAQEAATMQPTGKPELKFGAEADYNSRYVWRGIPFTEGSVFQPSIWAEYGKWNVNLWGNANLQKSDGRYFNEQDLTVTYSTQYGKLSVEPWIIHYWYSHVDDTPNTTEIAVDLSYPMKGFDVISTQARDIDQYDGAYFGSIGLSKEADYSNNISYAVDAKLGWGSGKFNKTYIGLDKTSLTSAVFDASVTYNLGKGWYVRPHLSYSRVLGSDLRDQLTRPNNTTAGIALGCEF